jgi:hypothetical protein
MSTIQYTVTNVASGKITNTWFSTFADGTYYEPGFGLPQRTLTGFIQTNQAGVASEAVVDVDGSIPDLTKALSTGTTTDMAGNTVHTYVMPAQYTVTAIDITDQLATQAAVAAAQAYLASTDWQAVRLAETGIPMDASVKTQRQAARVTINPNGVSAAAAKAT